MHLDVWGSGNVFDMNGLTSPTHLIILLLVVLLLFGAKRLPEIGRSLGTGMREFKDSVTGVTTDTAAELRAELPPPVAAPPVSAAPVMAPPIEAPVPVAPPVEVAPPAPVAPAAQEPAAESAPAPAPTEREAEHVS
jgi:sec-independent protein translocase protein TatA